jgi:hypothetical protein
MLAAKVGRERGKESPIPASAAIATLAGRTAASATLCTAITLTATPCATSATGSLQVFAHSTVKSLHLLPPAPRSQQRKLTRPLRYSATDERCSRRLFPDHAPGKADLWEVRGGRTARHTA